MNISADAMLLYELSSSLGRTLDPDRLCAEFVNVLLTRMNMGFGGVWSQVSKKPRDACEQDFELLYAHPAVRVRTHALPPDHPARALVTQGNPVTQGAQDGPIRGLIGGDDNSAGAYAVFPLREFGVLVLYSVRPGSFHARELARMRTVVDQFAVALEGAMAHSWVLRDVIEREAIIEAIPDLLFGIDRDAVLTWCNQAVEVGAPELRGRSVLSLFRPASHPAVHRALEDLAGCGRTQVEAWLATVPGDTLVQLNLVRLRDGTRGDVWAVGSARDITALKRAELRLRVTRNG